ncbi:hypothetical protein Ahy_A09g046559 [Arachis hypogaea]|uniref:Ras-related protein n=1 Tax=Arachis hypogaea TaxID=3818 RepID=A0A445BQ90_ARAHY|nr:hypothetical protein Ahy_A09g046559 [Arachis hypogaea]
MPIKMLVVYMRSGKTRSHKLVMALVANKSDLEPNREVEAKEAEKFAHESGVFYIETSVKTGENINDLFYEIDK